MNKTNVNPHLQAIQAALNNNWSKAIELNLSILKENPSDIDALLRLAKAYDESSRPVLSQRTYKSVLQIDKFNAIAKRGLLRLQTIKKHKIPRNQTCALLKSTLFLEEQGKTRAINLVSLTTPNILLNLKIAEELQLTMGRHTISVKDKFGRYLGRIPDDLSQRLIKLMARGNKYLAVVKEIDKKLLQIFLKEIKLSKRNAGIPSFPTTGEQYYSFLPEEAIREDE